MSTNMRFRLVAASMMAASALPGFASDKQDRLEELRARQAEQLSIHRYGRSAGSYQDRYERHADRRSLARSRYGERPAVVQRPARVVERPVYVERPIYVERPVHQAPVYADHAPYYDDRSVAGTIGGAVIGALIGSQVAPPEHRAAATVAGAVIGGVIGNGF